MKTQHVCDFLALTSAAMSICEMERLAGVCDHDALYSAAARAIRDPAEQWEKLMLVLKRRIRLRYERGELLAAERRTHALWCGEWKGEVA